MSENNGGYERLISQDSTGVETVLRPSIGEYFREVDDWFFECVKCRPGKNGMTLFRASNNDGSIQVAIKSHKKKQLNKEQFLATEAMYRSKVRFVRPIFLDHGCRFFVMEWVDAPLLSSELGSSQHNTIISSAGKWLADMQAATGAGPRKSGVIRDFRRPKVSFDWTFFRALLQFRKRIRETVSSSADLVRLHGDYHSGNIFRTENGLLGFDAQYDGFGSPFRDVARFLLDLALKRNAFECAGHSWPGDAESDRRNFFEGYGAIDLEMISMFDLVEKPPTLHLFLK